VSTKCGASVLTASRFSGRACPSAEPSVARQNVKLLVEIRTSLLRPAARSASLNCTSLSVHEGKGRHNTEGDSRVILQFGDLAMQRRINDTRRGQVYRYKRFASAFIGSNFQRRGLTEVTHSNTAFRMPTA